MFPWKLYAERSFIVAKNTAGIHAESQNRRDRVLVERSRSLLFLIHNITDGTPLLCTGELSVSSGRSPEYMGYNVHHRVLRVRAVKGPLTFHTIYKMDQGIDINISVV